MNGRNAFSHIIALRNHFAHSTEVNRGTKYSTASHTAHHSRSVPLLLLLLAQQIPTQIVAQHVFQVSIQFHLSCAVHTLHCHRLSPRSGCRCPCAGCRGILGSLDRCAVLVGLHSCRAEWYRCVYIKAQGPFSGACTLSATNRNVVPAPLFSLRNLSFPAGAATPPAPLLLLLLLAPTTPEAAGTAALSTHSTMRRSLMRVPWSPQPPTPCTASSIWQYHAVNGKFTSCATQKNPNSHTGIYERITTSCE
jgi:hypothetical protein